jgi:RHS repeat-associated protein
MIPSSVLNFENEIITTPTDTKTITTDYGYDNNDNLTSISNGLDSMSFGYNDRDLVESVTLGAGANATSVSYTYDGNGNILTVTDHYGHQTVYTYDGYDRLMQVTDPLSNVTLLTLFDKGNKLVIKNFDAQNLLRESIRINDPLGRLKSYEVKLPGGGSESYQYTYTDGYKTITITDSLNRSWTYKKNEKGQVYYEEDPAGNFTNYYYEDQWGNITKKEEHEKLPDDTEKVHVTKYKYNSQGKIEEIRELMDEENPNQENDEKDLITTFTYDTRGNLTGTRDAEGNKISHEYDGFNRKTLTKRYLKNGEEIKTSFTYYDNNLPKTITDDKGNITEYKFDDQKRLTKVIYPDLSEIEITYTKITKDEQDYKRVIITQRNGTIVTNDYDKLGRLVNRTIQKGENVEGTTFENFEYDGLNRLNYAENDNFVVEFKFDPLNRITEEKQRGKLLSYTYSAVDNLRRMTMKYPNDRLIEKNFDILDRLSNIKQADNEIANFKYIGRSYRLLSKQFGNGDAVSYLYDQGRRMTSKEAKNKNSDLINKYVYGYNKVHMKNYEQRMHENGIGDVFGYDAVYRLTNAKFNVPDPTAANPTDFERERNIFLDHVDNITRIDETKNGETSQITTEIPPDTDFLKLNQYSRFDQWGLGYDKNGNLTQKGTQKMYHDYRSQMVRVTEGTTTTENKYDALGRRLQKIVDTGSQSKTENYYYSGHQVIEVRDGSDQVRHQFIYGNGIDEVIRMDVYNGSSITPYYFHTNEIGSTTAVTDANGNVVERYKYGLFGMPTFMDAAGNVIPNSTIGNNILFQGREYEPETNFYYFRARHLDPIMGRFLQTDPMGYEDSLNLYQALNMNPVNFLDPFGEGIDAPVATRYRYDPKTRQLTWTQSWSGMYEHGGEAFAFATLLALDVASIPADKVLDFIEWAAQKTGIAKLLGFKPGEVKEVVGLTAVLVAGQPETAMVSTAARTRLSGFGSKYFGRVKNFLQKVIPKINSHKRPINKVKKVVQKEGTLDIVEARNWYHQQLDEIPSKIDSNLPLKERAIKAFELRNKAKIEARRLMKNRKAAEELDITDPIPTLKDIVRKAYKEKGIAGDDLWEYILESSTRSRKSVDKALGLTRNK